MPSRRIFVCLVALAVTSGVAFGQASKSGAAPSATAVPAPAPATLSVDQIKALIAKAAENDVQNDLKSMNYTYVSRSEQRFLDGQGRLQKTESETSEIMVLYGEQVERRIAKDDKPLSPKDAAKEEEKIQKVMQKREHESEDDRKKRLEKEQKQREENREFVREVADAYDFRFVGLEPVEGRDAYVIDAEPRPGFQPHTKDAKYLPKFRFRVWIDQADQQLVKLQAEAIDTVSWGLFLARIHKGTRFMLEQTRVNDEVWLPRHITATLDARLALFKSLHMDLDVNYKDYKKFRADTKITPLGEVTP